LVILVGDLSNVALHIVCRVLSFPSAWVQVFRRDVWTYANVLSFVGLEYCFITFY